MRSSSNGHTERNFCLNSASALMLGRACHLAFNLLPLFIYTALENNTVVVRAVVDCRRNPSWIRKHINNTYLKFRFGEARNETGC